MRWTKSIKSIAMVSVLTFSLAACSDETGTVVTPQQVVENVVKEDKKAFSYYAEATSILGDGYSFTMKEWRDVSGKARTEVKDNLGNESYSVKDESKVWTYDSASNQVFSFGLQDFDESTIYQSPIEQAKSFLKLIENTHTIEIVGEEKVLNRDVIHVKATPNPDNSSLFGKQELWIDKETWFILKMTCEVDDTVSTTEYTKFEINPTFEKDVFTFNVPEGAEVVDASTLGEEVVLKDVKEAVKYVDKPFYYVAEQGDIQLNEITVLESKNIPAQLTFNYVKNLLPYFSIVVTPVDEENKKYNGKDGLNVRGQEATLEELGEFRSISWVEDGIGYTVLIETADVTTEEILNLIENSVVINQ